MLEENSARVIFMIAGLVVLSLLILLIFQYWDEIAPLIDYLFKRKLIKM